MWNIESFTNGPRPNRRSVGADRIAILRRSLEDRKIDLAILLETGEDTAPELRNDPALERQYAIAGTAVTGRPTTPNYGGENYVVLHRRGLRYQPATIRIVHSPNPALHRGAVMMELAHSDSTLMALHAPSPGHPVKVRQGVIGHCIGVGKPTVFCGDLNFKVPEQDDLHATLHTLHGLERQGPWTRGPGAPTAALTSTRYARNGLLDGAPCQPYDQVWARVSQQIREVDLVEKTGPGLFESADAMAWAARRLTTLHPPVQRPRRHAVVATGNPLAHKVSEVAAALTLCRTVDTRMLSSGIRTSFRAALGRAQALFDAIQAADRGILDTNVVRRWVTFGAGLIECIDFLRIAATADPANLERIALRAKMSDHVGIVFVVELLNPV